MFQKCNFTNPAKLQTNSHGEVSVKIYVFRGDAWQMQLHEVFIVAILGLGADSGGICVSLPFPHEPVHVEESEFMYKTQSKESIAFHAGFYYN